jgi:hypothetical protein
MLFDHLSHLILIKYLVLVCMDTFDGGSGVFNTGLLLY